MFEFAYNNQTHLATGTSPFELDTRMCPWMGFEPHQESQKEAPQVFKEQMQQALEDAQAAMNQASHNMSSSYNLQQQVQERFPTGSKAWLSATNIQTTQPIKKLDD